LADRLFAELKRGPLSFVLNRIGLLDGGIRAFASGFWTPLYSRLQTLAAGQPFQHQLTIVVSDINNDSTIVDAHTAAASADDDLPDHSKPLRLSPLTDVTSRQLLTWLDAQNLPASRRATLADTVLKDDSGRDDRVPSRVFRRLREQWQENPI
jgi:hypothetical protein